MNRLFTVIALAISAPFFAYAAASASPDTYLSGEKFCSTYASITSLETPLRVSVPVNYADPSQGTISIYAYTLGPFDPKKPSYIYIYGGPGQNSHGGLPEFFGGEINEIRFDQRGLGCSAPETYAQYTNAQLYSTLNTVRDMEAIRQAYHIAQWSVYGISYGTVAATMYGSLFAAQTTSVVLEGVVGDLSLTNSDTDRAQKLNLIATTLNQAQSATFADLMSVPSDDRRNLTSVLVNFFTSDRGVKTAADVLSHIITKDGVFHLEVLSKGIEELDESAYTLPQQPGAIDPVVQTAIYCKELGQGALPETALDYVKGKGFFARQVDDNPADPDSMEGACIVAGVKPADRTTYNPANFKTARPVYYFQGSHDGATMAAGAFSHWKTVPQGVSYFLLAEKGGHNPNLNRIFIQDAGLARAETALFKDAILAKPISSAEVNRVNKLLVTGQTWVLYLAPPKTAAEQTNLDAQLKGMKFVIPFSDITNEN